MENAKLNLESWLTEEIEFINGKMAHTLNGRLNGRYVSCDKEKQEVTIEFPLLDWEVNGIATLHGGICSTMMDLVMCMAIYAFSQQSVPPTISMTTNYLRPVPMDGTVLVRARVTSMGRKNATAYSEIIIPKTGKTACTSIGTYAVVPKKD